MHGRKVSDLAFKFRGEVCVGKFSEDETSEFSLKGQKEMSQVKEGVGVEL